jgi:cell division protein FtsI/penicillin-binding protein 2
VGSNEFEVQPAINGKDIFLTIDPSLQKEIENLTRSYQQIFKADSASVIVLDPFSGKIRAMTNAPTFDPNYVNQIYDLQPLGPSQGYLLDNETYVDIPVFIETGGKIRVATVQERTDLKTPKYMSENIIGPQVLVDKNIAFPYEPGSIFKAFTV